VRHKDDEYVRRERGIAVTTNTVEGPFSTFKRGIKGVYQHRSKKRLHGYMAEFDFRYSYRVTNVVVGKRLTYQTVGLRT
jgi:hypothetical protein